MSRWPHSTRNATRWGLRGGMIFELLDDGGYTRARSRRVRRRVARALRRGRVTLPVRAESR